MGERYRSTAVTASCWVQFGPGPGLDGVLLGAVGARYEDDGLDGVLLGTVWSWSRP